jgi:hypothetical protein
MYGDSAEANDARAHLAGGAGRSGIGQGWDFFVSYTAVDRAWAEWIAWELEEAGYRVLVQAWDFVPGTHWVTRMNEGAMATRRTVAVLSPSYLSSVYGAQEWQAAWQQDPEGQRRRLLPVRVAECDRPGLLAGVVGVDLFGVPEDDARSRLLTAVAGTVAGRAKPATRPGFPARSDEPMPSGAAPSRVFPGRPRFPDEPAADGAGVAPSPSPRPAGTAGPDVACMSAGAVRRFVDEALTDDDLDDLSLDHFPVVHRGFAAGTGRRAKVRQLVEFADRQGRLEELVTLTRASNPAAYARHEQDLRTQ